MKEHGKKLTLYRTIFVSRSDESDEKDIDCESTVAKNNFVLLIPVQSEKNRVHSEINLG